MFFQGRLIKGPPRPTRINSNGDSVMKVERFFQNPIIRPSDITASQNDYEVIGAFNAGTAIYQGNIILLVRVAERPINATDELLVAPVYNPKTNSNDIYKFTKDDPNILDASDPRIFTHSEQTYITSISHLRLATSSDGINFTISDTPTISPQTKYETFGLEDPRITQIGEDYFITYKAVSELGICTGLIKTQDFINFERMGIIFCPENLDVVLFPEMISSKYYALTRPVPKNIGPLSIWIASSSNLREWGNHKAIITPRPGKYDSARVGASCVPIKTKRGWLEIYHGADESHRYCLGAALLDLQDPSKVLAYSKEPIMKPEAEYELNGFFGNVVFPCGCINDSDGNITIYYGASDETTCGATTTIGEILDLME